MRLGVYMYVVSLSLVPSSVCNIEKLGMGLGRRLVVTITSKLTHVTPGLTIKV